MGAVWVKNPIGFKVCQSSPRPWGCFPAPANGFALSARSDRPDESTETGGDSKLAAALEEWLGGTADSIASAAELADDELDRKLRSGELVRTNVPNQLENLMYREMHDVTDDTLQGR